MIAKKSQPLGTTLWRKYVQSVQQPTFNAPYRVGLQRVSETTHNDCSVIRKLKCIELRTSEMSPYAIRYQRLEELGRKSLCPSDRLARIRCVVAPH